MFARTFYSGGAQGSGTHLYLLSLGAAIASLNTPNTTRISYSARNIQKRSSFPLQTVSHVTMGRIAGRPSIRSLVCAREVDGG